MPTYQISKAVPRTTPETSLPRESNSTAPQEEEEIQQEQGRNDGRNEYLAHCVFVAPQHPEVAEDGNPVDLTMWNVMLLHTLQKYPLPARLGRHFP